MRWILAVTLAALRGGCADDPTDPEAFATFVVEVGGEVFRVEVATGEQAQALEERRTSGIRGVVSGTLRAGDGGFNAPWSWHLDAATVEAADLSIELCDGRPSMVEADLEYWTRTVKLFCPWGAKVVARE